MSRSDGVQDRARTRALIAGTTDYSGFSLQDCVSHLEDWVRSTSEVANDLEEHIEELRELGSGYIFNVAYDFGFSSIDFLNRVSDDLKRLKTEIRTGVRAAHLELIDQIASGVEFKHRTCIAFQRDYVHAGIDDQEVWNVMDRLYGDFRGMLFDYEDLASLRYRLKTFVDLPVAKGRLLHVVGDSVDVKPALFGISVDVKRLLKGLWDWMRGRNEQT